MTATSNAMAEGDDRVGGPDTRLLQDLISDMADAASYLEAAAEGLAEHRNGQYDVNVLATRLDAMEVAVAPLQGDDSLLVRVSVLENSSDNRKEGRTEMIALVAILIALSGVLADLVMRLLQQ